MYTRFWWESVPERRLLRRGRAALTLRPNTNVYRVLQAHMASSTPRPQSPTTARRFLPRAVFRICVIDTASPIFLCLPKVQSTPIRFTPASKSKWLRRTVEWNQGVRGAAAPKGPGGAAEGEPGWHTNDESVEGSQEIQSTGIRPSSDFKISAVLAQAFESACGR